MQLLLITHKLTGVTLFSACGPSLASVSLRSAALAGADLHFAVLYGADLSGADLREAALPEADLADANMQHANAAGADLRGASLQRTNLSGANLCGSDLRGACLRAATLYGADLSHALLERVTLTDAVYDVATQWPQGFDPARYGALLGTPPVTAEQPAAVLRGSHRVAMMGKSAIRANDAAALEARQIWDNEGGSPGAT